MLVFCKHWEVNYCSLTADLTHLQTQSAAAQLMEAIKMLQVPQRLIVRVNHHTGSLSHNSVKPKHTDTIHIFFRISVTYTSEDVIISNVRRK